MALGPDGHPTPEAVAYYKQRVAENRAKGAQVTGPNKIFNDAALAVEKVSADVESYWRFGSFRYETEPAETGIIRGIVSAAGNLIHKKPEVIGNAAITTDITALENIIKALPAEEGERCRSVIAKTKEHVELERKIVALERKIDDIPASPYTPAGLYGGVARVNLHLETIFRTAGARGRYHESCEYVRDRLFKLALAP